MEQNQAQAQNGQMSDEDRRKLFKLLVARSHDVEMRLEAIKVLPETDRQTELDGLLKKAVENNRWQLVRQIVNRCIQSDRREAVVESTLQWLFDAQLSWHAINFAERVEYKFTEDENKRLLAMFLEQGEYDDVCRLLRQVALSVSQQVEIIDKMVDDEAGLCVLDVVRELKLDEALIKKWAEKYLARALANGFFYTTAMDIANKYLQRRLTRKEYAVLRKVLVRGGHVKDLLLVASESGVPIRTNEVRRLFAGKLRQWGFIPAVQLIEHLPESEREPAKERALRKSLQAGIPEESQHIAKNVLHRELSVAEIEVMLKNQFRRQVWLDQVFETIKLLPPGRQMPWLMKLLRRGLRCNHSASREIREYILSMSW